MRDDQLIAVLIAKLPPAGAIWPQTGQLLWFRAFIAAADLIDGRSSGITAEIGREPDGIIIDNGGFLGHRHEAYTPSELQHRARRL